jgi:tetratricopeptide (TPR) repeat protein
MEIPRDAFGFTLKYLHFLFLCLTIPLSFASVRAQAPPKPAGARADYSTEAFVVEQDSARVDFENDGTYTRESVIRIRIQSDAGVQRFAVLTFSYQGATESVDVEYVRVRKADGTVVLTPQDNIQDMAAEITQQAPAYSDWREKHVAVKGLGVNDVLEFQCRWRATKPLVPGQFWLAYGFSHDFIVLQEQLQISVPAERPVKWKSPSLKPAITEDGGRRVFTWASSQLEHLSQEEEKTKGEQTAYQAARGKLPSPDVQVSSFQSWEDVGRWYGVLQQERVKPTEDVRAKAVELTKGLAGDNEKLRAIYDYVSTQFHYIAIDFGIGRYQPHWASEVLNNQYGDCKDKHTLLASLLSAVGIKAYPALINSAREIDPDVPSPGQFDHVVSVVSLGDGMTWLDTTSGAAPFAYLTSGLRDKQGLVIFENKSPTLTTTPADPPRKASETFRIEARLDDSGTLEGKIDRTVQGSDDELVLRMAFRSVPLPQWKDLVQRISYASGFSGDVSEATAGSPEKTDEPFRYAYSYLRKDYPDWSNHRISPPLPPMSLPSLPDGDRKPTQPIWLGSPSDVHYESHVNFPKGYTPQLPKAVDLREDFAEYHASYSVKDGVLTTDRRMVLKLREVPVGEYEAYKRFVKAVGDDHGFYIVLSKPRALVSYQEDIWDLPYSSNPEAARAYNEARDRSNQHDRDGEIASLKRATEIDPQFTRAWLWLGEMYKDAGRTDEALEAYRKAIAIDPQLPVSYKALGLALLKEKKSEEAIPVWQELIKVAPGDSGGPEGLGLCMVSLKRYAEATSAFESAVALNPQSPYLQGDLASAYLKAGEVEKAVAAIQKNIELDPEPMTFNNFAYMLAEADKKLDVALEYAQKAVSAEEEASQKVRMSDLKTEDLTRAANLAAFWDTLGWVYFRMGNFDRAEEYLKSAWLLSLGGTEADHLGQVYERQRKKDQAIHMYRLALFCFRQGTGQGEAIVNTRDRLEQLSPGTSGRDNFKEVLDEVNHIRAIKLDRLVPDSARAYFYLVFMRGDKTALAKIEDVKFIAGSDELKSAGKALMAATYGFTFPDDSQARILRLGMLGCFEYSGCSFTLLPNNMASVIPALAK